MTTGKQHTGSPPTDAAQDTEWLRHFPALESLHDPAWRQILASARNLRIPAGVTVFRDGDACRDYLLVIDGSVRVQKTSESGREIVLYRVEPGEACILTTSCLLARERYPAHGITETDVDAIAIPARHFQLGLARSDGFRAFVFGAYGKRIADLILLVEEVAFGRLDARLAQCLLEKAEGVEELHCTHQELASELGTAREVVSRQLKEFEHSGWLRLQRGRIAIRNRAALQAVVDSGTV